MEKSILYDIEIRHGAKMVEKTGITFPKVFSTVNIETSSVREKCVMFDMADKCKILVTGKDALQFIEFLSTVNIVPTFGSIYKTMFLYNNGKILDIVKVYYFNNQTLMIIIGINSFESTLSFMTNLSNGFDVNIIRINDECHQISLIGKLAKEVVSDELNINLDDLEKNEFVILDRDCKVIVYHEENIGNTYGIIASNDEIIRLYKSLTHNPLVLLGGLESYNTLRKKARSIEYGIDIDGTINPYEGNLESLIDYNHEFYGKEQLLILKAEKLKRKIVGLSLQIKAINVDHNELIYNGIVIGNLTSACVDVVEGECIGIGIMDADLIGKTEEVLVNNADKYIKAKIVSI